MHQLLSTRHPGILSVTLCFNGCDAQAKLFSSACNEYNHIFSQLSIPLTSSYLAIGYYFFLTTSVCTVSFHPTDKWARRGVSDVVLLTYVTFVFTS